MSARELIEALQLRVDVVRKNQAGRLGDLQGVVGAAFFLVGQAKQGERCTFFGVPDAFNGSDLGGLVFQRVQAMQVAHEDLQWHGHGHCYHGGV